MRNEREIREKIDKLFEFTSTKSIEAEVKEQACCQIDMLLWVLEDESGAKPIDER